MNVYIFGAIFGGLILLIVIVSLIGNVTTKKGGAKFLAKYPNAAKIFKERPRHGNLMIVLPKEYKGKYAYFIEEKTGGVVVLPGEPYTIQLSWQNRSANTVTTTKKLFTDFTPSANQSYIASYDETTKVFSIIEKS